MNRLKEVRLSRNVSQQELARKVKVSVSHLSKVENGERSLTLPLAARICKVLKCDTKDLFF